MFVHKMEGWWFNHPFWKAKFLIEDKERLAALQSAAMDAVIIDTAKGKDLTPEPAVQSAAQSAAQASVARDTKTRIGAIKSRTSADELPPRPVSTDKEVQSAQGIADRASERMHKAFLSARLGKALNVREIEPVTSDILASIRRNPQAFAGLMRCKLQNELTYRHGLAVSALMISLARHMKLNATAIKEAGLAGIFVDIGTNYLPQAINPPDGDYRNADPKIWEQHVILGYRALAGDDTMPDAVLDACMQHHERLDGSGFPNGLRENKIGQIGRMAAICDTFDHMLIPTASEKALDPAEAIQKLVAMEGAFDTEILRKFIESVGLYPVGSFVRLRSDTLALVIDEDRKDSAKPIVQAFYSYVSHTRIKPHRIALAQCEGKDEIVGIADLSGLGLPEDSHLREMIFLGAYSLGDNMQANSEAA